MNKYNDAMQSLIDEAIGILRLGAEMSELYYQKPLIVTYSGGKDSDVLLRLAEMSGINFEVINSHTTVDAPQTVYHIRKTFNRLRDKGIKCTVQMPTYKGEPTTMWKLIVEKQIPPTRLARYCCQVLKETSTPNRFVATGVRQSESTQRKGREAFETRVSNKENKTKNSLDRMREVFADAQSRAEQNPNAYDVWDCKFIETAKKKRDTICNPIIHWSDTDVWTFIRTEGIEYNPLYDRGYSRVGCIGCPLGGTISMQKEFADFPKYRDAYVRVFDRMIAKRIELGKGIDSRWASGEELLKWWIGDKSNVKGQMSLFDE